MTPAALRRPQQARSREKLERLLAAGADLVAEHGFETLRLADVARAAGCSVGVIYQRFADKEAFLLALRDRFCAAFTAETDAAIADRAVESFTTFDVLSYVVANHVAIFRREQGFLVALARRAATDPEAWRPLRALSDHIAATLADLIADRADVGCADPYQRMVFAVQTLHSTLLSTVAGHFGPYEIDDPDLVRQLVSMFARYLDLRRQPIHISADPEDER